MTRKTRHRIPPGYVRPSDPIDARYQAEVDHYTARLERAHLRALRAAQQAERRLDRAMNTRSTTKTALDQLRREVERRLDELHQIEVLMQPGNHASALHRGTASYGKVG